MAKTLFDKIWDSHVITDLGNGFVLLHIDRLLLHDLSGARALRDVTEKGYIPAQPRLVDATTDHAISTMPGRTEETFPPGAPLLRGLRENTKKFGIHLFDIGKDGNGIVHIVGPEQGLTLPGTTLVCGDSHTCTHGGMGSLAFGIGSSELEHVLATQTMVQRKPKRFRVQFEGKVPEGVTAKDMILHLIGDLGTAAGTGHAVEYAGSAVRGLTVEGRLTLCNLSIEMGARTGMVAPDDTTFEYLAGRPHAPTGRAWEDAVARWRTLASDESAVHAQSVTLDAADVAPMISWGTNPGMAIPIDGTVPDPRAAADARDRQALEQALRYMALEPGQPVLGRPVDVVFLGSCTNSRLTDLRAAADVMRGRRVAPGVRMLVVPGSEAVKRAAEAEGLHRAFVDAGAEWREPGCSMCIAMNGDRLAPGQVAVSTSNRNFEGRQGPGGRTMLASPLTAAACAVAGRVVDARTLA